MTANNENFRDCMTCRFRASLRAPPPSILSIEVCRRNPPQAIVAQGPGGETGTVSVFPMVASGLWCYQWEASKLVS